MTRGHRHAVAARAPGGSRVRPMMVLGVMAAVLCAPDAVRAEGNPGSRTLHDARRSLARYDLTGTGTTGLIAALGRAAETLRRPVDRREARFLRAMAAADLWIIAWRRDDPGLRKRVAQSWGAPRAAVAREVASQLQALRVGPFAAAADDALEALRHLEASREGGDVSWDTPRGLRTQALFTGTVRSALRDADDAVAALAPMGHDPCATGATEADDGACDARLRRFDATGRRALTALRASWRALDALARAGAQGDPLPAALRKVLEGDRRAVAEAVLAPGPHLEDLEGLTPAPAGTAPMVADMVLMVRQGEVRFGCAPRVRLDDEGELTLLTAGRPVLPDMARHRIPRDFRPAVQPMDALTAALEATEGLRVAVAAAQDVPAHVVARVLRSALRAGLRPVMLVGPGPQERIRGARIRVRDAREGPLGSPEATVFVRLGGYTVRSGRGKVDVPRVRGENGLRFDVRGLAAQIDGGAPDGAAVEFMTVVAMAPVSQAVFQLASAKGPVQLLIP